MSRGLHKLLTGVEVRAERQHQTTAAAGRAPAMLRRHCGGWWHPMKKDLTHDPA